MKNILFGFIMDGHAGGVDKYMLNFADSVRNSDVHFDFLTNKIDENLKKELEAKGYSLFEVPSLRNPKGQYNAICEILRQNKYDCAYFNASNAVSFLGPMAAKKCSVEKIIVHSHSSGYDAESPLERFVFTFLNKICRTFLHRYATDYYACSDYAGLGCSPKRLSIQQSLKL